MQPIRPVLDYGIEPTRGPLTPELAAIYAAGAERARGPMVAALIEPLHETTRGMEVAVVAYTKGQLSAEELWAELDWAASCYQKAAEATTQAEQAMRATPGLSERERQVLGAKFAQDAARYTAWAEGIKLRYVELTRD